MTKEIRPNTLRLLFLNICENLNEGEQEEAYLRLQDWIRSTHDSPLGKQLRSPGGTKFSNESSIEDCELRPEVA